MGLNSDISQVIKEIDKVIGSKEGRWLEVSDYNLKSKDRKNMKSIYGLIHDILYHVIDGQKIIDRTHKDSLEYLYKKCADHVQSN
tara:strand:- start:358 stop:612 length:255 start_codon:yes stop_codon:yes gene_type:complete